MGKIKYPEPVKLIAGMLFAEEDIFTIVKNRLINKYGEIDFESPLFPFYYTDYYFKEMGGKLWRKFVSFKNLIDPEKLPGIKIFTNKLESEFLQPGSSRRRINIDPGYIDLSKLVLATTKNFSHRIYIGRGIYAEVTLRYLKNSGFHPWEWTYPDYRSKDYLEVFNLIREKYYQQIKIKDRKNEKKCH